MVDHIVITCCARFRLCYHGLQKRGLIMIMCMVAFAFITYHLTPASISFVGKVSGGLFIWVLSVLDVEKRAKKYWGYI